MKKIDIDWNALFSAFQLTTPQVKSFLCTVDGQVLRLPPGDERWPEIQSNTQDYHQVEAIPSRIQYQWVEEFIATISDPDLQAKAKIAVNGQGAFRRFKDILLTSPGERKRWFEYRDEKLRVRISEWVAELECEGEIPPPWDAEGKLDETLIEKTEQTGEAASPNHLKDALIETFGAWAKEAPVTQDIPHDRLGALADQLLAAFHISSK